MDVLSHLFLQDAKFFVLANSTILSAVFLSLIPFEISLFQTGSHQTISLFMCKLQEQSDIKNSKTPYLYYTISVCIASLLKVQLNILYTLKSKHSCPLISQGTPYTQQLK